MSDSVSSFSRRVSMNAHVGYSLVSLLTCDTHVMLLNVKCSCRQQSVGEGDNQWSIPFGLFKVPVLRKALIHSSLLFRADVLSNPVVYASSCTHRLMPYALTVFMHLHNREEANFAIMKTDIMFCFSSCSAFKLQYWTFVLVLPKFNKMHKSTVDNFFLSSLLSLNGKRPCRHIKSLASHFERRHVPNRPCCFHHHMVLLLKSTN